MQLETFRRYVSHCLATEQDPIKQNAYRGVQQLLREHIATCADVAYHLSYWVSGSIAETERHPGRPPELEARISIQRTIHAHLRDVALGVIQIEFPLPEGTLWEGECNATTL